MFGKVAETPQTEKPRFHPRSPYGISKVAGFDLTRNYREAYGLHASSGILFNHESPRRGFEFVTRKITNPRGPHQARPGQRTAPGNLDAKRDWGYAKDYVQRHVADAPAAGTGRLRYRHRGDARAYANSG